MTASSGSGPTLSLPRALRALRAPALALLVTFGAAVVLSVLLLVALAMAGNGTDSEAVNASDNSGLMFIVGVPFQLTAMALLGTLHTSTELFDAGLYAPPLLLTGVYVLSLVVFAGRAERRAPAADAKQQAGLAAVGAAFVAVLALVVSRVLAARSDDLTVHAASVSLLFGSLFLTFIGLFVGRWRAAGAVWPVWVNADYVVAARLWAEQLLVWVVLALPVAFVVALVKANLATAITVPVWGPTAGLYGYVLGHVGSASVGGESFFGWDDSVLIGVVLIALAVITALVTAVAWHLRRLRPATADAASWAILPAVFACSGVVLWVASIVSVSGEFSVVGGAVTLQPAVWVIFLLAAWGALVELLSRSVAGQVAASLPSGVRARLGATPPRVGSPFGSPDEGPAPGTPVAPAPEMTPEQRARVRRYAIVGGSALFVIVLAAVGYSIANAKVYGPSGSASAYLDAVAGADVDKALDLAPLDDSAADDLMDKAVYEDAQDRVTGYDITSIEKSGGQATVKAKLQGVQGSRSVELTLEKDGHSHGIFDRWKVSDGGLASVVTVDLSDTGSSSLDVNGHSVSLDDSSTDLWALPGGYSFDPYADSRWVEAEPVATRVSPDEFGAYAEFAEPKPSQELQDEIDRQTHDWLVECMKTDQLDPDDCPQAAYYGDQSTVRNLAWKLDSEPKVSFDYFDGTFPADLSVDGGQATATYESDESYGFGPADWQPQTEKSDLSFSASVDVADDQIKVAFEPY